MHLTGHSHDHDHDHPADSSVHSHSHPEEDGGRWRTVLLGMAGGAVPCPEALALLLIAIGAGRMGAGLLMLLAFSLGLASVLFLVGWTVMNAGSFLNRFFAQKNRWFTRVLSVGSATAIVVIGLVFGYYAVLAL